MKSYQRAKVFRSNPPIELVLDPPRKLKSLALAPGTVEHQLDEKLSGSQSVPSNPPIKLVLDPPRRIPDKTPGLTFSETSGVEAGLQVATASAGEDLPLALSLNAVGLMPVQRRNARVKLLGSRNPSSNAIRPRFRRPS
ncbi:hypothetical protein LCGC14_0144420 [marine sediment metagenome]|uniref:Uncharacterized protein n=1 Tax=marine sediment metagenome TaxID=412755 RepID=A0A0F9VG31_9ZZZZ